MIAFQLSADTARFTKGMGEALKLMEGFTQASLKTQQAAKDFTLEAPKTAMDKGAASEKGGAGAAETQMASAAMGAQVQAGAIRSALEGAMAPLGQMQTRIGAMTDRMGGAMVTLARRINSSMRFPTVIKNLEKVNSAVGAPFRAADSAITGLERRFNVFGPTTSAAFDVVRDKIIKFRDTLDKRLRFDDLIGRWVRFVGSLRKANQPFTDRAAITGIQLTGAAILALAGKGIPAFLRIKVAARQALVQAPLAAIGAWMKLRNAMSSVGDVARKSLSKLFTFPIAAPIAGVKKFNASLAAVSPTAAKAGTSIKAFGSQVLVALGAFGFAYKAVDFFKSGLKGASDLNETVNKTGVIFGNQASIVGKAAGDMANRFGTVKGEFMDTADTFGQLLIGMGGQSQKAAAETSVTLTKMAANATSLFNDTFGGASGKIASALRGQSEPISAYGIDLQEAAVKAQAARMGIASLKGELTTSQKVAARTALIMRGLAVAQGDLENTAEEPANAMREFQGRMTNLANDVGALFIPALKAGLAAANEFAKLLTGGFASAKEGFTAFAESVASGFNTIGVVFRNFPLVVDIVALKFREMALNVIAYIGTIPANLGIIATYIAGNWRQLITDAINAVGAVFKNLGTNIGELANSIYQFLKDPTKGFQFNWTPLLDGFKATAAQLPELIKPELVSMQKEIDAAMAQIAKNEAARVGVAKKAAARPLPLEDVDAAGKKKKKKKEDVAAGAFVLGSQEAASAVAQYGNRTKDAAAKDTAKNTAQANKILQRIENKLAPAVRAGQPIAAREF